MGIAIAIRKHVLVCGRRLSRALAVTGGAMSRSTVVARVLCVGVLTCQAVAWGAPGDLDTSFGIDGTATNETKSSLGAALLRQGDGKLLVGGFSEDESHLRLARFTAAGSLDATFGTNGEVTTDLGYPFKLYGSYGATRIAGLTGDANGTVIAVGMGWQRIDPDP